PDNRDPVDFEIRKQYLNQFLEMEAKGESAKAISSELVKSKWDGRLKLYVLWKGLQLRLQNPEMFLGGDYIPLKIEGERKENVIAFMRRRAGKSALIVAGRFFADLISGSDQTPTGKEVWRNTEIILPENIGENTKLTDIFSGKEAVIFRRNGSTMINVDDLLSTLSVSILTGELEENQRR
ncbi:MAG TPA: hypothetical protein VD913_01865, partial [bacterium]|nr:hypothetical protein [bacterium]